jgi:hypothetical protein
MYIGIGIISSLAYLLLLKRENAKRERGERDEIIGDDTSKGHERNGRFDTIADAKREKGDTWSGYRYTV